MSETKEGNELVLVASQLRRCRGHGLFNVYKSRLHTPHNQSLLH